MDFPPFARVSRRAGLWAFVAAWVFLAGAASARAQQQEGGVMDRILHPDRTLAFEGADKQFATSASFGGKQATVKTFAFSKTANLKGGDGSFNTKAFAQKDRFQTKDFTYRTTATTKNFAQTDKTFGTKTMDVKEDRAANKSAPISEYVPGEKPYLGRGKRQDDFDDLYHQKNLNIDQVRQLLNKPGGSTDAPYQRIEEASAPRAQAVTAPNAR